MIFLCKKCGQSFDSNGLHVVIHEQSLFRVCPACLDDADELRIVLSKKSPGVFEVEAIRTEQVIR